MIEFLLITLLANLDIFLALTKVNIKITSLPQAYIINFISIQSSRSLSQIHNTLLLPKKSKILYLGLVAE